MAYILLGFNSSCTSGGVGTFGDRLSVEDLEFGEERSSERRECGVVDGELLVSVLFTALLLNFDILGVAPGDDFPGVVAAASDKLVLFPTKTTTPKSISARKLTETNN